MNLRLLTPLVATCVAISCWGLPRVARACSCGPYIELAAPNDSLGENQALVFRASCGGTLDTIEVTLDGQPASLVIDDELTQGGHVAAWLDPAPELGQQLVVRSCANAFLEDCAPEDYEEVGTLAIVAPLQPHAREVQDLELTHKGEVTQPGCDEPYDLTFDVRATIDDPDGPPRMYAVVLEAEGGVEFRRTGLVQDGTEELHFAISSRESDLMTDPGDYCVSITTIDLTGSVSDEVAACNSTPEESGCACTAGNTTETPLALMLLIPLWLRIRRGRLER